MIKVPEGKNKENEEELIDKDIMGDNFLGLKKGMSPQTRLILSH